MNPRKTFGFFDFWFLYLYQMYEWAKECPTLQKAKQNTSGFSTFVLTWCKQKQNTQGRFVLSHAKSKRKTTFLVFGFSISSNFMNERKVPKLAKTETKNKLFFDFCFNMIKKNNEKRRADLFYITPKWNEKRIFSIFISPLLKSLWMKRKCTDLEWFSIFSLNWKSNWRLIHRLFDTRILPATVNVI